MAIPTAPSGVNISRIFYLERTLRNGFIGRIEMRPRGSSYVTLPNIKWVKIPKQAIVSIDIKSPSWEDIPVGFSDGSTAKINIDLSILIDIYSDENNPDTDYKTDIEYLYRYLIFPSITIEPGDDVQLECNVDDPTGDLYGSNFKLNVAILGDDGAYSLAQDNFLDEKVTPKETINANFYNTWIFSSTGRDDYWSGDYTWIITDGTYKDSEDRYTMPESDITGFNNKKPAYIEGIFSQNIQTERKVDLFKSVDIISIELSDSIHTTMQELTFDHLLNAIWSSHMYQPTGFIEWKRKITVDKDRYGSFHGLHYYSVGDPSTLTSPEPCKFIDIYDESTDDLKTFNSHIYTLDGELEPMNPDYMISLDYFYEIFYLLINTYWLNYVMHNIDVKESKEFLPENIGPVGIGANISEESLYRHPYFYHNFSNKLAFGYVNGDYPWYMENDIKLRNDAPFFIYASQRGSKSSDRTYPLTYPDKSLQGKFLPMISDGLLVNRNPQSLQKQYRNLLDFYKDNVAGAGCYGKVQYSPIFNFNGNNNDDITPLYTQSYFYWHFHNNKIVAKDDSDFNPTNLFFDLKNTNKCELSLSNFIIASTKSSTKGYSTRCNMEAFNKTYKSKKPVTDEELNIKSITWSNLPTARLIGSGGSLTTNKDQKADHVIRKLYRYGMNYSGNYSASMILVDQNVRLHVTTKHDTIYYGWEYTQTPYLFDWTKSSEKITGEIQDYQNKVGYNKAVNDYYMSNLTFKSQFLIEFETIWEPTGEYNYLLGPRNVGIVYDLGDSITGDLNEEIINTYGELPTKGILMSANLDTEKCIITASFFVPGTKINGEIPLK